MKTTEESESLEVAAWRSMSRAYKTVHAKITSDLRQFGLTFPQYTVMRTLHRNNGRSLPMNEIGREMIVTFGNVTTIVDNLERLSFVRRFRDSGDRRIVRVELTPQGRELAKRLSTAHRKKVFELMSGLSHPELCNLVDYTTRIRARAGDL